MSPPPPIRRAGGPVPPDPRLVAYRKAFQRSSRIGREPPHAGTVLVFRPERVLRRRAGGMALHERLPSDALGEAAYGGLQDSAPRSAQLSLHARVEDVGPTAWEDSSLVQIWFRWSDYVVPRRDVATFTLGALPRDPDQVAALQALADRVVAMLADGPRPTREITSALEDRHIIRATSLTGRVHIRWDASSIVALAAEPPDVDAEDARLELARRYLHWFGPSGPLAFARWAGVSVADSRHTWAGLSDELLAADVGGEGRWLLACDEPGVAAATPPVGVRLLPPGDPYLRLDPHLLAPAGRQTVPEVTPEIPPRLVNALAGRIMVDGELLGAWARTRADVTLWPWAGLLEKDRDRVGAEAVSVGAALGEAGSVRWLA